MALQVTAVETHDSEVDNPAWLSCILPPLEDPKGRTSWCQTCQTIPEATLNKLYVSFDGFENETLPPERNPNCVFCGLIPQLKYRESSLFSSVDLTQSPKSGGQIIIRETRVSRTNDISMVLSGRRSRWLTSQDFSGSPLSSTRSYSVNFANLRAKMVHCSGFHKKKCDRKGGATMEDTKLINCTTRMVTPSGGGKNYAALSYVWGSSAASCATTSGKLVGQMERTVEDALLVTKEMGLNYLWIDRYCIAQDDPGKHRQIGQMDLIYRNADLTIVAAAGNDPSYGLPGISIPRRSAVESCRIGNHVLFRTDPGGPGAYMNMLVQRSKWSSRAWTFQEALFSKRCLVFTDHGASFCCPEMDLHLGIETNRVIDTQLRGAPRNSFIGPLYISGGTDASISTAIHEYTCRSLTYASDALNGFLGTLRAYEANDPPTHHFWGVPIFSAMYWQQDWIPTAEIFLWGMSWNLTQPSLRRPGFPSWSWAGWEGAVMCRDMSEAHINFHEPTRLVQIKIELEGGEMLDWSEFEKQAFLKGQSIDTLSPVIHLQAWTIEVTIRDFMLEATSHVGENRTRRLCAHYMDRCGHEFLSPLRIDDKSLNEPEARAKMQDQKFKAIVLGSRPWTGRKVYSIVVAENHGATERFAVFQLGDGRYQLPAREGRRDDNLEDFDVVWRYIRLR